MIRLTIPSIEEADLQAVREVLATGYLVQGKHVAAFEEVMRNYVGTRHAVALCNCTAALHLALLALQIRPGHRVAVATYSYPATANVIALCGAEPVFIEIEATTFNMDPDALAQALAHNDVQAIMPVHTFGGMADMPRIMAVADRYGVPVIEDAACALGTMLAGRHAGTWGAIGCFSFHPRKAVTTGEGGMATTDDSTLARAMRVLRNHGLDPDAATPDFIMPGFNLRLTEFQAALGNSQMEKVDRIIESRRRNAACYDRLLRDTELAVPQALAGSRHVYQSYVALLPRWAAPRRAAIITALKAEGIETTIGTYHMPLTTYFRARGNFSPGDFPVTDDVAARAISLPLYEGITEEQQETVVHALLNTIESIAG